MLFSHQEIALEMTGLPSKEQGEDVPFKEKMEFLVQLISLRSTKQVVCLWVCVCDKNAIKQSKDLISKGYHRSRNILVAGKISVIQRKALEVLLNPPPSKYSKLGLILSKLAVKCSSSLIWHFKRKALESTCYGSN